MASARPTQRSRDTHQRALVVATQLMQQRGFHGFTFHDVAAALGVSHVAVHHHYRTKADLVAAALQAYTDQFVAELAAIEQRVDAPKQRLEAYIALFEASSAGGEQLCLCGVLAAEMATLPPSVQPGVRTFYEANEAWLARQLAALTGARATTARVKTLARGLLDLLEGALVSARAFTDPARVGAVARGWLALLNAG
ncbi:MAG: TetR/AcrR family transcriptional regulator [Planctomycetota bacterium]